MGAPASRTLRGRCASSSSCSASDARRAIARAPPRPSRTSRSSPSFLFKNMSGDPEQDHFCDGLVDDILTTLSKVAGLRVIARHSSFAFKDRALDVREVGRQLGARYVLEGGMRKSGKRIRINAQLIDASDGAHVWAERYDRALDDIFAIQDEITLALATEMQVKLTEGEQARLRYSTTSNVEAWSRWVEGLSHYRRGITKDNTAAATAAWEKALALDPASGALHAMLAWMHLSRCALRLAGRSTEGGGEGPRPCRARACARSRQRGRAHDLGRIDVDREAVRRGGGGGAKGSRARARISRPCPFGKLLFELRRAARGGDCREPKSHDPQSELSGHITSAISAWRSGSRARRRTPSPRSRLSMRACPEQGFGLADLVIVYQGERTNGRGGGRGATPDGREAWLHGRWVAQDADHGRRGAPGFRRRSIGGRRSSGPRAAFQG